MNIRISIIVSFRTLMCGRFVLFFLCLQDHVIRMPAAESVNVKCGGTLTEDETLYDRVQDDQFEGNITKLNPFGSSLTELHTKYKSMPFNSQRPPHLNFTIKIWPTRSFVNKIYKNDTYMNTYKTAINKAVKFFESLLGVRPHNQTGLVNVRTGHCLEDDDDVINETNSQMLDIGGYDFHIIMNAGSTNSCLEGTVVAWAANCGNFSKTYARFYNDSYTVSQRRPLVGYIYMCQNHLFSNKIDYVVLGNVLKHEILHTLGVSGVYFLRPNRSNRLYNHIEYNNTIISRFAGLVYIVLDETKHNWTSAYGTYERNVTYSVLPAVQEAARTHFNCPTVIGAEVEDSGSTGTKGQHWEKRVFGPILMTGSVSRRSYFSNITLQFLRSLFFCVSYDVSKKKVDFGYPCNYTPWYPWVNKTMASDTWYGKNAGCQFAEESCKSHIDSTPLTAQLPHTASFPFCSKENAMDYLELLEKKRQRSQQTTCSPDRQSVLICSLSKPIKGNDKAILSTLYYEGSGKIRRLRGTSELTEYCPAFTEHSFDGKDAYCRNEHVQLAGGKNSGGELFGRSSRCIEQSIPFTKINCTEGGWRRFLLGKGYNRYPSYPGAGCYEFQCAHGRLMVQAAGLQGWYGFKVCWSKNTKITIRRMLDASTFVFGELTCPSCLELCDYCEPDVFGIEPRDQLKSPCATGSVRHKPQYMILIMLCLVQCTRFILM